MENTELKENIKEGGWKKMFAHWFTIIVFVFLYAVVSIISTIHVVDFFRLSNPDWLAISLAIAFEIGAAASLAALIVLDKINQTLVWLLFITLTSMQAMGNTYYAFIHLADYRSWIELFGLVEWEVIAQKRILAIISGAILPLIALGFIKSLVDYIRPENALIKKKDEDDDEETENLNDGDKSDLIKRIDNMQNKIDKQAEEEKDYKKRLENKNEELIQQKSNFENKLDDLKKDMETDRKKTQFEKTLDKIKKIKDEGKPEISEIEIEPKQKARKIIKQKDKPI